MAEREFAEYSLGLQSCSENKNAKNEAINDDQGETLKKLEVHQFRCIMDFMDFLFEGIRALSTIIFFVNFFLFRFGF